jgi:F-type H+-transporting ATPase subunit b
MTSTLSIPAHARASLATAAIALLTPALAWASDGGFVFTIHGYYIINFVIFVGLIVYFARKPVQASLQARYDAVAREMEEAQAMKAEAEEKYAEYKARVERLDTEIQKVLDDVEAGTAAEVDHILADARVAVEKITAEEAVRLAQEGKRLRQELAREAAGLAVELAEGLIKERLNPGVHQQLVATALSDLEKLDVTQTPANEVNA